jgi:branched-subunit amino acid transport protein
MNLWPVLLGMAAVTFALRASFLVLPPGMETPALLRRALRYVPPAVLTAIWAPELVFRGNELLLSLENERLLAGVVAIAVAWRTRLTFATIISGLVALHLFAWLI